MNREEIIQELADKFRSRDNEKTIRSWKELAEIAYDFLADKIGVEASGEWKRVDQEEPPQYSKILVMDKAGNIHTGGYYAENNKVCITFPDGIVWCYDIEDYFIQWKLIAFHPAHKLNSEQEAQVSDADELFHKCNSLIKENNRLEELLKLLDVPDNVIETFSTKEITGEDKKWALKAIKEYEGKKV